MIPAGLGFAGAPVCSSGCVLSTFCVSGCEPLGSGLVASCSALVGFGSVPACCVNFGSGCVSFTSLVAGCVASVGSMTGGACSVRIGVATARALGVATALPSSGASKQNAAPD